MRHPRHVGLAALVLAATASSAFAQRSVNTGAGAGAGGFWELGTDFIGFTSRSFKGGGSDTNFGFGSGNIRAGYFVTEVISVEPTLTFSHNSSKSGGLSSTTSSSTSLGLEVGLLYHLQSDNTQAQWYARPFFGLDNTSSKFGSSPSSSFNQNHVGVGVGYKMPSMMNKKFALRMEAAWTDYLKSGANQGSTQLGVMAGVSVFTK